MNRYKDGMMNIMAMSKINCKIYCRKFTAEIIKDKLKKVKEIPNTGPKNVTNALFVGSTTELQKMLKEKK